MSDNFAIKWQRSERGITGLEIHPVVLPNRKFNSILTAMINHLQRTMDSLFRTFKSSLNALSGKYACIKCALKTQLDKLQ